MKTFANSRRAAYDVLLETERGGYANLLIKQALSEKMSDEDRRFATALTYTTLDHLLTIDFIIDSYAKGRLQLPVRCVLRLGVCQLLYMDVPESAACNESVLLIKAIGKQAVSGFVNGTLRAIARAKDNLPQPQGSPAEVLSIVHSYPLWLVERLLALYGDREAQVMLSYRDEPMLSVRENSFRAQKGEVEAALCARGISFTRGHFDAEAILIKNSMNIAKDELFKSGKLTIQSESSMLVSKIADPKKGMKVLDACAAPGGKSAHMAAIMGEGEIVAWDVHAHREELIKKSCERMGVGFVRTALQDAADYVQEYERSFDVVLVDAPCSGLGVVGGKPDVRYSKSPKDIEALVIIQRKILENCSRYVKKGGSLIYSTCTIMHEENEDNVQWFLKHHTEFVPDDLSRFLPDDFDKTRLAGGFLQLYPHIDFVDGFFVSRMVL